VHSKFQNIAKSITMLKKMALNMLLSDRFIIASNKKEQLKPTKTIDIQNETQSAN
jgi:hypothetical protein